MFLAILYFVVDIIIKFSLFPISAFRGFHYKVIIP